MTAPFSGPSAISFDCEVVGGDFRRFAQQLLAHLKATGFPAVSGWRSAKERKGDAASLMVAIDRLPDSPHEAGDDAGYLQFDLGANSFGSMSFHPDWDGRGLSTLNLQTVFDEAAGDSELLLFQRRCMELCKALLLEHHVYSADLLADGGGALCIPDVALVTTNSHIAVTNKDEVEERYDDPAAFWGAGWAIAAEHAGQRLLTREMDLLAGPEYLERIIDHQWAMARAAKANETGYDDPEILPEEDAIFHSGPARLEFVGYSASEKQIEYSCVLGESQHIQGWEIYALRQIVKTRKTPDGKAAVKTVRIVFMEEWMAQSEKRPLLDIGCRLFHYDAAGELRELVD